MSYKKNELIFSIIAVAIVAAMFAYGSWERKAVDAHPVYVLAKVYSIQDTENGLIYSFKYYFESVEHDAGLKGFIQLQDSMILLKISKANPKIWKHVEGRVAKCLAKDSLLKRTWTDPPLCE